MLEKKGVVKATAPTLTAEERPVTPNLLTMASKVIIETPSGSQQLQATTRKLATVYPSFNNPSQRLFSVKASKALNQHAQTIAFLKAKIETLEAQIDQNAKVERKSVKTGPNDDFARMTHVRKAKRELRSRVIYTDEAIDCNILEREDTDTEEVIEVRIARS